MPPGGMDSQNSHLAARQAYAVQLHQVRVPQHVQALRFGAECALAGRVPPNLHLLWWAKGLGGEGSVGVG